MWDNYNGIVMFKSHVIKFLRLDDQIWDGVWKKEKNQIKWKDRGLP